LPARIFSGKLSTKAVSCFLVLYQPLTKEGEYKMGKPPFLIALEGIDGCGKSTQSMAVKLWLESIGIRTTVFDETYDNTPIGSLIRNILQKKVPFPGNLELQRLFTLDRAQRWHCFVRPELESGKTCVLAGYAYSSLAYAKAFGIDAEDILAMQRQIIGPSFRWPDVTLIIHVSPLEALKRSRVSNTDAERFKKLNYFESMWEAYLNLFRRRDIGNMIIVNGELTYEEVSLSVNTTLRDELGL
jgi:dTMP kinase